jgi:hypothetical protein
LSEEVRFEEDDRQETSSDFEEFLSVRISSLFDGPEETFERDPTLVVGDSELDRHLSRELTVGRIRSTLRESREDFADHGCRDDEISSSSTFDRVLKPWYPLRPFR